MSSFTLAYSVVILLALLTLSLYVTMHDDQTEDRADGPRRWGLEACRVALVMQLLALFAVLSDGPDVAELVRTSVAFQLVGLGAWTGARTTGLLARRAGWGFAGVEAVEFVGLTAGVAVGRFAGHVLNNALNVAFFAEPWTWFWANDGLSSIFVGVELMGLALLTLLVGSIRLIYHVRLYGEQRRRETQETTLLRLREQAARAQLQSIQARINPHFLYNALGSLAGLIHDRPDQAEAMTLSLARLFRASLDAGAAPLTTVRREVELVETYLTVETARFGPRLRTVLDVAPDVLDVPLPRFLLQPLVENAVRHGIGPRPEGGTVRLCIRREGPDLVVAVRDDGPAFPDDLTPGYGLASVRESLALLYPGRHDLALENGLDKGVRIVLAS